MFGRAHIEPHFLFNSLSTVLSLLMRMQKKPVLRRKE